MDNAISVDDEDGEGEVEDGRSGGTALNPLPDGGGTRAKTTLGNGLEAGTLCTGGIRGCACRFGEGAIFGDSAGGERGGAKWEC